GNGPVGRFETLTDDGVTGGIPYGCDCGGRCCGVLLFMPLTESRLRSYSGRACVYECAEDGYAGAPTERPAGCGCCTLSKPVAITVIFTRPSKLGSCTAPKIIFASGCAARLMISAASLTSNRVISMPPVMLKSTPRAPLISISSRGLAMAI